MTTQPIEYNFPYTFSIDFLLPLKLTEQNALLVASPTSRAVKVWGDLLPPPSSEIRVKVCFSREGDTTCSTMNEFGQYMILLVSGTYTMTVAARGNSVIEREVTIPTSAFYFEPLKPDDPDVRRFLIRVENR